MDKQFDQRTRSSAQAGQAYELVCLLYQSLTEARACLRFRDALSLQLDAQLRSVLVRIEGEKLLVAYGLEPAAEPFAEQSLSDCDDERSPTKQGRLQAAALLESACGPVPPVFENVEGQDGTASAWTMIWRDSELLVQIVFEPQAQELDRDLFACEHRDLFDYLLPHFGAAISIHRKRKARVARLNTVRTIHAMLPFPLLVQRAEDKSPSPNLQATGLMNRLVSASPENTIAGLNADPRMHSTKASKAMAVRFPMRSLGLSADYQVKLITSDVLTATAVNKKLLQQCFGLAAAEAELCVCAMQGRSPQDIAAHLRVSINTVKGRLRSVYRQLGVKSVAQLAALLYFHPAYWAANYGRAAKARLYSQESQREAAE